MDKLKVSVGILSWKSPKTLRHTLQSYKDNGLFNLTDDIIIFFQEMTDTDRDIAEEFGINYIIQSSGNIGIGRAFTELMRSAKYDNVLLLEEDWVLLHSFGFVYDELSDGIELLDRGIADMVKYRSRSNPGDPLYSRTLQGREFEQPHHLLECVFWEDNPDLKFPEFIKRVDARYTWYVADSKHAMHTNNPAMFKKKFYLEHVSKFSGSGISLEGNILGYWTENNFHVAHSEGLFRHERLDRP